jgi:hypothetical protein
VWSTLDYGDAAAFLATFKRAGEKLRRLRMQ